MGVFSRGRSLALVLALASAGCTKALNYADPSGPRYEGHFAGVDADPALRIVTFNIKYSREIDRAIELFQKNHELQNPDIIALQEMNNAGVDRIARGYLTRPYVVYRSRDTRHG